MNLLLIGDIYKYDNRVWVEKRRVLKDVWMEIIEKLLHLEEAYKYAFKMTKYGGRYLLTAKYFHQLWSQRLQLCRNPAGVLFDDVMFDERYLFPKLRVVQQKTSRFFA